MKCPPSPELLLSRKTPRHAINCDVKTTANAKVLYIARFLRIELNVGKQTNNGCTEREEKVSQFSLSSSCIKGWRKEGQGGELGRDF